MLMDDFFDHYEMVCFYEDLEEAGRKDADVKLKQNEGK